MTSIPLLVVTAIVTTWTLFRIAIFFSIPQFCLPPYEFWIDTAPSRWPLFGVFVFVFFLLAAWTACLILVANRTDRRFLMLCGAATLLIGFGLVSVSNSMEVIYLQETNGFAQWLQNPDARWDRRVCDDAKPFLGEWRVVYVESPFLGQQFSYETVELKRDRTFLASNGRFREPTEGYWNPPSTWDDVGTIWTSEQDGVWVFDLEGIRLTLTTPVALEEPISTVILERM